MTIERTTRSGLLLAALLGLVAGCGPQDPPDHLILVIMDTTRADRIGCYGHVSAETATLDSLATAGVRFDQAITAAPVTGPSIATILSGALPPVHGIRDNGRFEFDPRLELLAESLRDAGYRTGAVVAALPIHSDFGFGRGFESYDDRFHEDRYTIYNPAFRAKAQTLAVSERRAESVTDRALRWLDDAVADRPIALLVHYFDPHGPYDPPPAFQDGARDPYDGEVAYMDAEIGRLLAGVRERLGTDRLHLLAVGDHGEGLGDHGEATHGFFVYDPTVRVPLIVCGPGAEPGLVVADQVRTCDITPTLCGWLGLDLPADATGADLTPALAGGPVPAVCDTAYIETFLTQLRHDWSPLQAIRTSRWKWIRAPRPELYDLAADAGELTDLSGDSPEIARALAEVQEDLLFFAEKRAVEVGAAVRADDPELARQLEALGYVSRLGGDRKLVADYTLTDPKDGVPQWDLEMRRKSALSAARVLAERGRTEQALMLLDRADTMAPLTGPDAALRDSVRRVLGR